MGEGQKRALDARYNPGYTPPMKTAISVPDDLFERAERAARERGISRSELYATALREYLSKQQLGEVTAQLDAIYADEASALDPGLDRRQRQSLPLEDW